MKIQIRAFAWAALACCALVLASPLSAATTLRTQTSGQASPAIERAKILATAQSFADLRWRASDKNVSHGAAADGVHVDTPDVSIDPTGWHADGRENIGMPYSWGGFSSVADFQKEIDAGQLAGHVPRSENVFASQATAGVDCSGFVSRCWNLPEKQSTRSLGGLCYELESYDELEAGDIINAFDSHVVLFKEFANAEHTELRVIEAARLRVEESIYTREQLRARGFKPMRYKPLDERWEPMECSNARFEAAASDTGVFTPAAAAEVQSIEAVSHPLERATALSWARYATDEAGTTVAWMIARSGYGVTEAQRLLNARGEMLATGVNWTDATPLHQLLTDFMGITNPFKEIEVTRSVVTDGTYELGARTFKAQHLTATLKGFVLARHKLYPLTLEIDAVVSDEIPVAGILAGRFDSRVVWKTDENGDETISESSSSFRLLEFGSDE